MNSNFNQHSERLKELRALLNKANHAYYILDAPEIADSIYDQLYRELIEIENIHPSLITDDSPSQRLGGIPSKGFKNVEHNIPLLSLDNAFNIDELKASGFLEKRSAIATITDIAGKNEVLEDQEADDEETLEDFIPEKSSS